jgi:S-adenosylmethionine synthetase
MTEFNLRAAGPPPGGLPAEIVEHKGLGHPDSICDALTETLSLNLSRRYLAQFGAIQHHNVDKALLVGGAAAPAFGGGEIVKPVEIFLAGRATSSRRGQTVAVEEIARDGSLDWLRANLHALDPARDVRLHFLIRPGSPDLVELFERAAKSGTVLANDTSCGVGFAPLSELESAVSATARWLNGPQGRRFHPALGEDIKVMGLREGRRIGLTIACAMIGRFLASAAEYLELKSRLAAALQAEAQNHTRCDVTVEVNTADSPETGALYLTVSGTSAESGDDGEAGRGNRANGLITPYRPMTMESVAGKNPVSHVGKIYNLAAGLIAERIAAEIPEVVSAECYLVSQIGRPIREPRLADIAIHAAADVAAFRPAIAKILAEELERLDGHWRALLSGELALLRWPFAGPGITPSAPR